MRGSRGSRRPLLLLVFYFFSRCVIPTFDPSLLSFHEWSYSMNELGKGEMEREEENEGYWLTTHFIKNTSFSLLVSFIFSHFLLLFLSFSSASSSYFSSFFLHLHHIIHRSLNALLLISSFYSPCFT